MTSRLLVAALLLSACASAPPKFVKHGPSEEGDNEGFAAAAVERPERPAPVTATATATATGHSERKVRVLMKEPSGKDFVLIGKVDGEANLGEWVAASRLARVDLQRKAAALGADVVTIDDMLVPPEGQHGRFKLLVGRAYKAKVVVVETD